ncbi:short-chain dehydrogenase [Xylaria sp. CBS 124048]|nr:short-chain dehydrogenase [Xylaria sp. CBS 124048]
MARTLEGKLAIVTGASRGIGEAIAIKLASYGANIVIGYTSDSSKPKAESLANHLESKYNVKTCQVQADLGTLEGPKSLVETVKSNSSLFKPDGPFQIDIIINNAGVAHNNLLPAVTPEQYDISYRVNVRGPLLLVQAAQPYLPQDRSGRIVNISSTSSSAGFIEQSIYGGTKAALEAMTRTWARELSERCTVNSVNPGPVVSEMYDSNSPEFLKDIGNWIRHAPLMRVRPGIDSQELVDAAERTGGRPAYMSEIAGIVAMVVSEDAAWCTGQVISANGGMLLH